MEFLKIKEIVFNKLKPKLENNKGLAIFAKYTKNQVQDKLKWVKDFIGRELS